MLLFKEEHIKLIQNGTKTETRRLWKKQRANVGSIHLMKLKMLSNVNYGKILIKKVRQEHLSDITEQGAMAEGGYTREEYMNLWFEINPKSPPNPILFALRFEYLGR